MQAHARRIGLERIC